ncbi:hypothetical protein AB0F81_26035 [Actinoplanes sp. NPDC024001]|uniref:NADase-type glycan-binding domain-containing protein n=1 Tax=Actinoplanes sp. NPDC024001 TaxID=3154598 RepID=UPI0033DEB50C
MVIHAPASPELTVLGWAATCCGLAALFLSGVPLPLVVLPLAAVTVALSTVALYRGGAGLVAHGLTGMVTALVSVAVTVALILTAPATTGVRRQPGEPGGAGGALPPTQKLAAPVPVVLGPASVAASRTAGPSTDSAGNTVRFSATNVLDGDPSTAWRVAGSGVDVVLAFEFAEPVHLSAVGIIPGYAKVDSGNGVDRFTQNRRVREARWTFTDGSALDTRFTDDREIQYVDVDVDTTVVQLAITGSSRRTDRNYTAISEVVFVGWPIR